MSSTTERPPRLSVIVPARDEEVCIDECLRSLASQQGIACEFVVVDDGSIDRTAALAAAVEGVTVIPAGTPPLGWSGKNHAATVGAARARGEWLLFTDADTVHAPGALARAVAEAETAGAALLSYSPRQLLAGFWQHALMPLVFAELEAVFDPAAVSGATGAAAANGQFMLMRRDAYDAIGGHRAVAGELLEDVALARAFKAAGYSLSFRQAHEAVATRMYRSVPQMIEGWTRNLAPLFPDAGGRALRRAVEGLALLGGPVLALLLALGGQPVAALASAVLTLAVAVPFARRLRKACFPLSANLLAPLGLPLFAWLLLRSRLDHRRGKVRWKGRTYGPVPPEGAPTTPAGDTE